MPPKPRAPRKASIAKDVTVTKGAKGAMPPPPAPGPAAAPLPALPKAILEPEMDALSICLRNAVVKTGQIYGFYADTRRLYTPYPPRNLTASLGREIEKYEQLCDAMEAHLLRAISVLQRDLNREEQRHKAEAAIAAAQAAALPKTSLSSPATSVALLPSLPIVSNSPTAIPGSVTRPPEPVTDYVTAAKALNPQSQATPLLPKAASASMTSRRQSIISLSSLHRPVFPHKLDLSSAALRLNPEEVLQSTLPSPVTLAPKSSVLSALPSEINLALDAQGQQVEIDLTHGDDGTGGGTEGGTNDPALGSSADKPIELDFDMDLFGDARQGETSADAVSGLFTGPTQDSKGKQKEDVHMGGIDIVNALSGMSHPGQNATDVSSASSLLAMMSTQTGHQTTTNGSVQMRPSANSDYDLTSLDFDQIGSQFFDGQVENHNISLSSEEMAQLFHAGDS